MGTLSRNKARSERGGNSGKTVITATVAHTECVDLAAILVQDDAMAPTYCAGDVVLYRRPSEELTWQPGDDVLVLLPGLTCNLQLFLRRLVRWDEEMLELRALNPHFPTIREHPRNAVLCGKVERRLG